MCAISEFNPLITTVTLFIRTFSNNSNPLSAYVIISTASCGTTVSHLAAGSTLIFKTSAFSFLNSPKLFGLLLDALIIIVMFIQSCCLEITVEWFASFGTTFSHLAAEGIAADALVFPIAARFFRAE